MISEGSVSRPVSSRSTSRWNCSLRKLAGFVQPGCTIVADGALHCPLYTVRQIELKAGVALSAVVNVTDDGHRIRSLGARIENRVQLPVQASPGKKMVLALQLAFIVVQNDISFGEIAIGKAWNRVLHESPARAGREW
jgi:hypothetical protein